MFWEFSADREADLLGAAWEVLQGTAAAPEDPGTDEGHPVRPDCTRTADSEQGAVAEAEWGPNPVQPGSACRFRLASSGSIRLAIFDPGGPYFRANLLAIGAYVLLVAGANIAGIAIVGRLTSENSGKNWLR